MKTLHVLFSVFLAVCFLPVNSALASSGSTTWYRLGNDSRLPVSAPKSSSGRYLTFVGMSSYLPGNDDDFSFRTSVTGDNSYVIQTAGGNDKSHVKFAVTTWEVPSYVQWKRTNIRLGSKKQQTSSWISVPPGHEAVTVVELLSYWTGGDDDLSYAIRAVAVDRTIMVAAISDFGRAGESYVEFRVTVLYWPSELGASCEVRRLVATENGGMNTSFPTDGRWFSAPSAYMTDTSKYQYSAFDSLVTQFFNSSLAGKSVDMGGLVKDSAAFGIALTSGDSTQMASSLGAALFKHLIPNLGADERDDDFWVDFVSAGKNEYRQVGLTIGSGNRYSLAEATVWNCWFP